MGLTPIDKALWLISFVAQLLLLAVLFGRKCAPIFPCFTVFIAFDSVQDILNYSAYRMAGSTTYFWTYSVLGVLDTVLQLAVVFEMARVVLRPTGTWVRDARGLFIGLGSAGAVIAFALSFAVKPEAPSSLYAWSIRLDLFTSLLIAELVVAMSFAAQRLGLQWRNWVMGLGRGLMLWVSLSLIVETAHSYLGWTRDYVAFDHLRILAYIAALGYWSLVFWRAEPERRPVSPEMVKYLFSLQRNLDYDLRRVQGKNH